MGKAAAVAKAPEKRKTKAKKEGPKKPMSGYIFFSNKRRVEIIKEKPELRSKVTELSKLIGAEWRELEDSAKVPFTKEAEKDKLRYAKELEEHEKKQKK